MEQPETRSPQANDGRVFHCFPNLLIELRMQIWREALPEPRIIYSNSGYQKFLGSSITMLSVCTESRQVALESYTPWICSQDKRAFTGLFPNLRAHDLVEAELPNPASSSASKEISQKRETNESRVVLETRDRPPRESESRIEQPEEDVMKISLRKENCAPYSFIDFENDIYRLSVLDWRAFYSASCQKGGNCRKTPRRLKHLALWHWEPLVIGDSRRHRCRHNLPRNMLLHVVSILKTFKNLETLIMVGAEDADGALKPQPLVIKTSPREFREGRLVEIAFRGVEEKARKSLEDFDLCKTNNPNWKVPDLKFAKLVRR